MVISGNRAVAASACALLLGLGLLIWKLGGQAPANRGQAASPARSSYSNVRQADYVGPKVCSECHEDRYEQWRVNLHRRMNRLADEPEAIVGDFSNLRLAYGAGALVLQTLGDSYYMSFEKEGALYRKYRVTRSIGSRYLQEYVGVQVEGPEPAEDLVYQTEIRLPFGYLLSAKRWLHQQYFDSWYGAEYLPDGSPALDVFDPEQEAWRGRCAWCHNTYPFEKRLARITESEQVGSGIELLYVDRAKAAAGADAPGLLAVEDLVTVGISCESCHFGGREHAMEGKAIRFAPAGQGIEANPDAPSIAGTRRDSRTINSICAQCHSVPTQLFANGAGTRNSSEALDLMSGDCASRIKCTDCHDPHVPGPGAMAAAQARHLQACVSCHQNLAEDEAARRHSKHDEQTTCLDCHMPRIVQGMDTLIRSHRIGSPNDEEMLRGGVNACNLCHLDESLAWTVMVLNRDFGQALVMDLDERPAGEFWLLSSDRSQRLVAAGSMRLGPPSSAFLPLLIQGLADPVAHDRLRYLWAVQAVLGRKLADDEYQVVGPPAQHREQVQALLQSL